MLIVIFLLVVVGLFCTLNSIDLDFMFSVIESDIDLVTENIVINAKLIRFPFNLGIIYGHLTINQTEYKISRLNILPDKLNQTNETYRFNLENKNDQELLNGSGILMYDLDSRKALDLIISFEKMDLKIGKSRTEQIYGTIIE